MKKQDTNKHKECCLKCVTNKGQHCKNCENKTQQECQHCGKPMPEGCKYGHKQDCSDFVSFPCQPSKKEEQLRCEKHNRILIGKSTCVDCEQDLPPQVSEDTEWEKEFDKEFGKPAPYKQRDRTLSQIKHAFDNDEAGEILDDYKDNQAQMQAAGYQDLYDRTKVFIRTLLANREQQLRLELVEKVEKLKHDEDYYDDPKYEVRVLAKEIHDWIINEVLEILKGR